MTSDFFPTNHQNKFLDQQSMSLLIVIVLIALANATCTNNYYLYDGSCNNEENPERGSTNYVYHKGPEGLEIGDIPVVLSPANQSYALFSARPNERVISNNVIQTHVITPNDRGLNLLSVLFGQFVVHDLSKVARPTDARSNVPITNDNDFFLFNFDGTPKTGVSTAAAKVVGVRRSGGRSVDGHFEPHNEVSGWLDLSTVYGSSTLVNDVIRGTKVDGKFWLPDWTVDLSTFYGQPKGTTLFTEPAFLPILTNTPLPVDVANIGQNLSQVFVAGDSRCSENIVTTTFHIVFAREHNRVAEKVKLANPTWTDEEIFQAARKYVVALYQHIVYDEYLETIWGRRNFNNYVGRYKGYKTNVDGSTGLTWATAAMRVGHSNVKQNVNLFDGCGNRRTDIGMNGTLAAAGTGTQTAPSNGANPPANPGEVLGLSQGYSNVIQSALFEKAEDGDNFIVDALTNILINSNFATGIDVAVSNIRRGRIHSTPNYHTLRKTWYPTGPKKAIYGTPGCSASESSPGPDPLPCWKKFIESTATANAMRDTFSKITNVDAYVGLLVEKKEGNDSNFGPTATAIVLDQFKRARDGDRFFYENLPQSVLSRADKREIERTSFSELIKRHSDVVTINSNAFKTPAKADRSCPKNH